MNPVAQTDIDERLHGAFPARLGIDPGVDERQLDVAQARRSWQQVKCLKNKPDLAISNRRQFVVIHLGHIFAIEVVMTRRGCVEATEHVHEGRLATAARAHDRDVFVAMNLQGHAA